MVFLFQTCEFSLTMNGARDDMVYDQLKKSDEETKPLPIDEDLPGMGQYYCLHCEYASPSFFLRKVQFFTVLKFSIYGFILYIYIFSGALFDCRE